MAEKTDLNISPYYDDYSEDKKFHKVLYRAGRPLQARELTQSQSILQNQISRLGDHFFEEGTIIQGAQANIDMDVYYVKVKAANPNPSGNTAVETYRESFHGKYVRGQTSGVVAKVVTSTAETSADKLTLFVRPVQQGTTATNDFLFQASETLELVGYDSSGTVSADSASQNDFEIQPTSESPVGRASLAEISEGVVFVRGFFTKVDKQIILLEKYNGAPSYRVGLDITETLVTSSADGTLLDNAAGSSNENAGGADRLQFNLVLGKHKLDSILGTSFVELTRVNKGVITLKIDKTKYAEIENTLARRTFEANGDFVVNQFTASSREHLDTGDNLGFYAAANGGDADRFVFMVSPGKAYVRGYEIDKVGTTTLSINKARTTESLNNVSAPIRLGNKLRVYNTHGLPEFGNETGQDTIDPHNPVLLYDGLKATLGISDTDALNLNSSTGNIGTARVRNVDHVSGVDTSDVYGTDALFNMYMFDIKMFTKLTGTIANTFVAGDKVTGSVSGATAIVHHVEGSNLFVHDVQGAFRIDDNISAEGAGSTATLTSTNTAPRAYNIDRARSVAQLPNVAGREIFTGDVFLDADQVLAGTVTFTAGSQAVSGFATQFVKELKEGDQILDQKGNINTVASVTSETALNLVSNSGSGTTASGNAIRRRAKLIDQNQTANIHAWPRDWVKTHSPDFVTVRRQVTKLVSSGGFSITTNAGETFGARNTDNFAISVREPAGGYAAGDVLNIEDLSPNVTTSGSTETLACTVASSNNNAVIDVTYTVTISDPTARGKSLAQARCLKVGSPRSSNGFYGTAYDDKDITLGVADVHKIIAVYEGVDGTPITPNGVITTSSGTFVNYEELIGQTSGARAILINNGGGNASYWYYTSKDGATFVGGETVVGQTSIAVGVLGATISQGSPDIKDRYFFDNGQRDGFYDLSKLTLKPGQPTPNGPIMVLFDYFRVSGGGDFFDVSSYSAIDYSQIPVYSPNKVDLGGLEPDGTFELSDCLDFRPVVGQIIGSATFGTNNSQDPSSPVDISNSTSGAVFAPFGYESGRSFLGARTIGGTTVISETNANAVDVPVSGTSLKGDISFYVGRIDKIFLHKKGKFEISQGTPALSPTKPTGLDDCIQLFELQIPAYTNKLKDVRVRSFDHRRYTMKDIGKIQNRVTNLERITSLSLLEKDTQTKQILDADGFDRYKSGFLVDNFRGHKIGDVNHPDYNCAIDTAMGMLRPKAFTQFFGVTQNEGASSNYQKTGDIITLPYDEVSYVNQDKASRSINVNPYHVFAFIGNIKLSPDTDIWQDTERLPDVSINREGNFDAVLAENANALGTVWNSWQTTWVGEPTTTSSEVQATSNGSWSGDPLQGGEWVAGLQITREITDTPEIQTRTGVTTTVVEDLVETRNDRIVSMSLIPFIRAKTIEIDATNLKPNSNHYFYFDNIIINKYVRPYNANYSQDSGTTVASHCKTDGNGRLRAYFELPNTAVQRFPTGSRELRITSSLYNMPNPASQGTTLYTAQGILQASQTEIISTRNARVIREDRSMQRDFSRRGERLNSEIHDTTAPDLPPRPVNEVPVDNNPPPEPDLTPIPGPLPDEVDIIPPILIQDLIVEIPNIIPEIVFVPPVLTFPTPPHVPQVMVIQDRREMPELQLDRPMIQVLNGGNPRGWGDPLAQSFLVDTVGGLDLTSIDLYFATKDTFMPCSVQIRNMVNGYPGQLVLPFSDVTKNPEDINISADGSVKTTFTFDSMVHLNEDTEYCFVVYSNSNEYEAFISRMGETDLTTAETISGQPYAGSLFLSQNASTWTAEQTDDLKFNLKAAKYQIDKVGSVHFENDALPAANLQVNPIETFANNKLKVYSYFHGLYDDTFNRDNVTLAGITGDKQNSAVNVASFSQIGSDTLPSDGTIDCTADVHSGGTGSGIKCEVIISSGAITDVNILKCGQGYTAADNITITNIGSSNADVSVVLGTVEDTLGGCPISLINATHSTISDRGIDSFRITPSLTAYDFSSSYVFETTVGGGANATSTRNYYFDSLHTMIPSVQLKGTLISANVLTTPMYSPEGIIDGNVYQRRTANRFVTMNDNVFFGSPSIVASPENEAAEMSSQKSFNLQLQLMSFNPNISPMIDVQAAGCLGTGNRINNIDSASSTKNNGTTTSLPAGTPFVPSTESEGDSNAMVYVTRKVNLKTPATSLKVIADIFRPPTSEVKLMYKIIKNDEETLLDDVGFEYFNTDGSPDVTTEEDARNFKEYEFTANDLPEFSGFVVKIVGQGTSTSIVPAVTALRCMALA